jgi:hypothetical protein
VTRSPTTAAERMREYRRRRRYGVLSIRVRVARVLIDALIKRRYLKPEDRDDLATTTRTMPATLQHTRLRGGCGRMSA